MNGINLTPSPDETPSLDPAEQADGHPHTLAFLSGVNQVKSRNLGVSRFGQAGDVEDVYRFHGIDVDSIVRAALDVIA